MYKNNVATQFKKNNATYDVINLIIFILHEIGYCKINIYINYFV